MNGCLLYACRLGKLVSFSSMKFKFRINNSIRIGDFMNCGAGGLVARAKLCAGEENCPKLILSVSSLFVVVVVFSILICNTH